MIRKVFLLSNLIFAIQAFSQTATLVNYDFNSGTSFATLSPSLTTGISSSVTCTDGWLTYSGTASGSNAFSSNTVAGNGIGISNSGGTNTRYWTFSIAGSALSNYTSFKVYFQAQRSAQGAQVVTLAYSTNGSTYTNFTTTAAPGNGSYAECQFNLSSLTVINNTSNLYFKVMASNAGGTGSGTGTLRIDNFQLQGAYNPPVTPTITATQSFVEFTTTAVGSPSNSQSINIVGANLTNDITVNAPAGFEVASSSGNYSSSLTLTQSSGSVNSRINIRYNPSSLTQQYISSGNQLSITSSGATSRNYDLLGSIQNLNKGDIAVIGINPTTTDAIAFVALNTIPQGTIIKFTDNGYSDSLTQMSGEGIIIYTAPSNINAGTVVSWTNGMSISGTGWNISSPTDFAMSTSGDQLFAFQGNWAITGGQTNLLEAFNYGNSGWLTGTTSGNNNSALPYVLNLSGSGAMTTNSIDFFMTNSTNNTVQTPSNVYISSYTISSFTFSNAAVTFPNWAFKLLANEPTQNGTLYASTNITTDSFTLNFNGGNGSSCLIVMRKAYPITGLPNDANSYSANSTYGAGSTLSSGDFAIYNGTVNTTSITVSGLTTGSTYYYAIFPYNGTGNSINYKTSTLITDSTQTVGYTINNNSFISLDAGFTYPSNIAYQNYQTNSIGIPNNNKDIEVAKYIIQDGNGVTFDNDTNSTILDSLSFQITKYKTLNKVALYSGNTKLDEVNSAKNITFHNLNLWVPDNTNLPLSIRVSFASSVTDTTQFYFTITNAYANANGSGFSSANAGGVITSTNGNDNRIDVVATKMLLTQSPTNTIQGVVIQPYITASAVDSLGNLDLNYNSACMVQSNSSFDTTSVVTEYAIAGKVSFVFVKFNNPSKTNTVWVSSGALTNSANSANFIVYKGSNSGDVIISEIMYNVTGDNEWAEIHNTTPDTVYISQWYLTDAGQYPANNEGALTFQNGTYLLPYEYRVVSLNGLYLDSITNDVQDITNELRPVCSYSTGPKLNNSGDNLALYNAAIQGVLIDGSLSVLYPNLLTGSLNGISIERKKDSIWTNTSWALSTTPYNSSIMTYCTPNQANIPPAPISITFDSVSFTSSKVLWRNVKGNNTYYYDIATDRNFNSILTFYQNVLVNNDTTAHISGLAANTKYYFRVSTLSKSNNFSVYTIDSFSTLSYGINIQLKAYFEGFMRSNNSMVSRLNFYDNSIPGNYCDTIQITLIDSASLSDIFTIKTIIDTNGLTPVIQIPSIYFNNIVYIKAVHKGHIGTWTASPVNLNGSIYIDFTQSASTAFGSNLLTLGNGINVFYAGDINGDDVVSNDDIVILDNDNFNFVSGYVYSDLNGDGIISNDDVVIADNNNTNFISSMHP